MFKKAGSSQTASSGKVVNPGVTKGKEGDYARLQAKDPSTWASHEVGMWLEIIDLAEYTIPFIENSVGGAELFDLTDEDLVSMHITKLGHRKKLLKAIQSLNSKPKKANDEDERSSKDNDKHSGSQSGTRDSFPSADAPGSSSKINVKCFYGNDTRAFTVKNSITVNKLKRKIKEEFGKRMTLKYKDSDGDLISIRKDGDLKNAIRGSGGRGLKLYLTERARTTLSRGETGVLETLVDAVVIMDKHCGVLFMNKAAERVFGYDRTEIIGQNVKALMPSSQASAHDDYVNSYIRTGEAKIIGKGRKVIGKRKDGSTTMLQLAVSENRSDGRHTFTGTMQELSESTNTTPTLGGGGLTLPQSAVSYAILQNLLDVVIVIDEKGTVQFMNTQALKMFGYGTTEVFGKNIKMLMPDQYKHSHDTYLSNYMTSNQAKVIGKGRDVLAQHKDGSIIPVNLTVTEQRMSDTQRVFTGILRKVDEDDGRVPTKSVLQQDREVLEALVVPAIIIDEKGAIQAFNKPSQELFGFAMEEVLGKNVKLLMPSPDKEKHDAYIKAYLTSGKAKVIGTGRDVVALHRTGALVPIRLSVTVRNDGNKKLFTGVLQKIDRPDPGNTNLVRSPSSARTSTKAPRIKSTTLNSPPV